MNINTTKDDRWIWRDGTNGLPINKSIYNTLLKNIKGQGEEGEKWKIRWKLPTTHKIKIFGWKLLHKKLPTLHRLSKLGMRKDTTCRL